MIEMLKQWAAALVITAAAGSAAVSVTISENGKSLKKYIKFACALVALAVMISPIRGMFAGFSDLFGYNIQRNSESEQEFESERVIYSDEQERINNLVIKKTNELLKERISDAVYQKTGIKPENIYIYININPEDNNKESQIRIDVKKAEINMPENSEINIKETETYLKGLLDFDISINGEKKNE